jgi:hypothetical protein
MGTSRKGPGRELLVMGPVDRYGCGRAGNDATRRPATSRSAPNTPTCRSPNVAPGLTNAVAWRRATTPDHRTNRDESRPAEALGKG